MEGKHADDGYDELADWYEQEFLGGQASDPARADGDPLGIGRALRDLLGEGSGICLEIGCGTGVRATQVSELGWIPVGVDLSAGMLWYARGRLPVARADAERLPVGDSSVPAVVSVMAHTDMPGYPAVLREAARILRPGGVFVHVGVHPCFCGGFADRSDLNAVAGVDAVDQPWPAARLDRDQCGHRDAPVGRAGYLHHRGAAAPVPDPTNLDTADAQPFPVSACATSVPTLVTLASIHCVNRVSCGRVDAKGAL